MIENPFSTEDLPDTEPESIVKGAYEAWRRELSDIDGPDYSVKYVLTPVAGGAQQTVTGTESGDYWEFEVLAADTATWDTGEFRWDMMVVRVSDSEEAILESDSLTVFESNGDRRTHAEVMLGKIESVLHGRADHDIESYSIKQRSLTRMSVKELTGWCDYYLDEVRRTGGSTKKENAASDNTLRVRFIK